MFKVITRFLNRIALKSYGKKLAEAEFLQLARTEARLMTGEAQKLAFQVEELAQGRIPAELMNRPDVASRLAKFGEKEAGHLVEREKIARELFEELNPRYETLMGEADDVLKWIDDLEAGKTFRIAGSGGGGINGVVPMGIMDFLATEPSDIVVGFEKGKLPSMAGAAGALNKAMMDPSTMIDVACETIPSCGETVRQGEAKIAETVMGAYDSIAGNNEPGVTKTAVDRAASVWKVAEGQTAAPANQPPVSSSISP